MKLRTLIVDDDIAVAGVHRGFVEAHGAFEIVGVAHTGAEAVRMADELEPELVLLDIHLPDISGIEVLRQLRAGGLDVDVIAITAARELETVRAAMAGGVVQYIVKPFGAAVFHSRLDEFLAQRAEAFRMSGSGLDQEAIDRLMGVRQSAEAPSVLPKGLSPHTLGLVERALADAMADVSAREVAEQAGLSRVSARRYLEYLAGEGRASVHPRYGTSGRPEHGFRALSR